MSFTTSIQLRLWHQHETLAELIDGFSETELKQRVNPDKWSIFENVAHLATYQLVFIQRMALILAGGGPSFERYVAEKDPLFYDYLQKSPQQLEEDIIANRQFIINRLDEVKERELNVYGNHPKYGLMAMSQWTEFFLLHEAHHLYTIFMLSRELTNLQRK